MADNQNASPATIEEYLSGMDFPASREDLVQHARQQNAPHSVIATLERVDEGEYNSPIEVSSAVGMVE